MSKSQLAAALNRWRPSERFELHQVATRGILLRALARAIAETQSRRIWRVLCDATAVDTPIGTCEKYEIGAELARAADRHMIMAVVARAELIDYFFETVARNRGASVRVFTHEATAHQWLFSIPTVPTGAESE